VRPRTGYRPLLSHSLAVGVAGAALGVVVGLVVRGVAGAAIAVVGVEFEVAVLSRRVARGVAEGASHIGVAR
jgi:hypothetical protein